MNDNRAASVFSERESAGSPAVLNYSGEHNIPITTNPYGFFLLFPCYQLLRACQLALDIALPKNPQHPFCLTTVRLQETVRYFKIKSFLMSFSFSFVAIKRERKERKERENTLPLPTLLRALNKMDVCKQSLLSNAHYRS